MSSYTIKDLEKISGIKAHTIRIWKQRYQFLQPQRTETNIRTYSSDELKTILNVSLLNKYGFKISHIDKMSAEQMEEKILSLNQIDAQKERVVNALIKANKRFDMLILPTQRHGFGDMNEYWFWRTADYFAKYLLGDNTERSVDIDELNKDIERKK